MTDLRVESPLVRADPAQLQQVILNLVKNAIEAMSFMPPDGRRLNVGTRLEGGSSIVLFVQDAGPGVQPDAGSFHRALNRSFKSQCTPQEASETPIRTIQERSVQPYDVKGLDLVTVWPKRYSMSRGWPVTQGVAIQPHSRI